ncbi:MAG: cytochrome c [Phenylobacterium sp.]|uniref:c-type cytochrome n=1 Tax=Phenylobacterium sp. TaxID=1871053 RepID=UPI002727EE94|nr:cytochrome c [Phenylobacterium sp.]MDO8411846.1 cytochrome c [Phenylobacterium sp.]
MSIPSLAHLTTRARLGLTGVTLALLMAGCGQQAGETETAQAPPVVSERQEGYKALGSSFKLINDQLKSGAPDMAQIAPAAERMHELAQQIPNWFPAGSGPQDGVKTDALETVWTNPEGFAAAQQRLVAATAELQQLAAAGDATALEAHVKVVGASCGGCHDDFRVEQ